jgi:hypothetical protein
MLWEDVDLTLIEVGGFRSLRGGMGRCSGSGRSFSIVESVERERDGFGCLVDDCCVNVRK